MTTPTHDDRVLERNVETLLETGGEAPRMSAVSRARIRAELIARHGRTAPARKRIPSLALGLGLAATAAAALLVLRAGGGDGGRGGAVEPAASTLADGSTFIAGPGATLTTLGPRRVRVDGAVLLDVVPGPGTFVVETARGRIEVLGTRFLVDAAAARTTAAVIRGQVKLATAHGDVLLHAGEQGVAEPGKPPTRGPAPRLSHLVSWAAQARRQAEPAVAPVRTGTLYARSPGVRGDGDHGPEYPLPLVKLGVDVVVENQVARVALDQTFHNAQAQTLEGVYRFAIPPDAALQRLAMYVDGKLTESAVVERMRARRIYEELVYRRVDPALLEWAGTGRLSLRVYPLPAHQDKRLVLAYTQSLPSLYGDWSLSVPLPEIDQPVGELAFDVTMRGCARCEITSTSHPISVARAGDDAVVRYRGQRARIGDSLVLRVRDARQAPQVATHAAGDDRYLMVRAPADLERQARAYRPRTWVILDDVSASRGALERAAQVELIDAFARELDEDDRLAVIAFDVTARQKLAPTRVLDVDRAALRSALGEEGEVGATDFGAALSAAAELLAGVAPDDAMLVYLGDGVITSGPRELDVLRAQLAGRARFVGVGVGDGPDTQTLEALAAATGGYATTIDLADDVRWRAFDLVAALHTARVTGLEARLVDARGAHVPATLYLRSPQLADGEELELVARLAGAGSPVAVELTGTLDGAPWQRRIELRDADRAGDAAAAGYLPRLWAQRHIAARLLAKHEPVVLAPCAPGAACPTEAAARAARDEAIRKEVVELGKRYFLLSRHTSLLVLENDAMYAQYGVTKGAGDTWAPYALPATIPVIAAARPPAPVGGGDETELVRAPMPVFYGEQPGQGARGWGGEAWGDVLGGVVGAGHDVGGGTSWLAKNLGGGGVGVGRLGTVGRGGGGASAGFGERDHARTRGQLGLADAKPKAATAGADRPNAAASVAPSPEPSEAADPPPAVVTIPPVDEAEARTRTAVPPFSGPMPPVVSPPPARWDLERGRRQRGEDAHFSGMGGGRRGGAGLWSALAPLRYASPADRAYDDLTALVPALFPDASDAWRAHLTELTDAAPAHPIDPAAQLLLEAARRAVPTGVYRWGDLEIAVDGARRLGWRRTTDAGLVETASFDGTTWTRRYAELGLDVTRALADADVALALAYLPVWIAEPAHYARWFAVDMRGPRRIALSRIVDGTRRLALELELDDRHHLVALRDADGRELVRVGWDATGPIAARVLGEDVAVGFTGQALTDASAWAHAATSAPSVVVELPCRMPAYWQDRVATASAGSPAWRHAQRQLMASLAAVGNPVALFEAYEALRTHGGVALGDLVLASSGLVHGWTEPQVATALAAVPGAVARYLAAGRAYARSPRPEQLAPEVTTGMIGALWQLREVTALVVANRPARAVDRLVSMSPSAPELRRVGAAVVTNQGNATAAELGRAWDAVAVGSYRNVARAHAAVAMANRGAIEAAADRVAALVADLDLHAPPPRFEQLATLIRQSRRGDAGWQLMWRGLHDRVLASGSYHHVMALVPLRAYMPALDLAPILTRAVALAGADLDQHVAIARLAMSHGLTELALGVIEPQLKARGTRALYQLAAQLAHAQGRIADALTHLEAAQRAGADEPVELATVRAELAQILGLARQLATRSAGAARDGAIARALTWGRRWRALDPGNPQIDVQLGELLLAVGDTAEAWRQLSTAIERDPMSGDGYMKVAEAFVRHGRVVDALPLWQQAIVIEQTNPTPRLRKAEALFALGRIGEGEALLAEITARTWHPIWSGVAYQARAMLDRSRQTR